MLSQFLGICPFLGVSNKINTSLGMAGAVTFVIVLATIVTYLLQVFVLNTLGLEFMQTIVFILPKTKQGLLIFTNSDTGGSGM